VDEVLHLGSDVIHDVAVPLVHQFMSFSHLFL